MMVTLAAPEPKLNSSFFPRQKRFVLLTTSHVGVHLSRGLVAAGHRLVRVGVGIAKSKSAPVGSVAAEDVSRILGAPTEQIGLESEKDLIEFLSSGDYDFAIISWPRLISRAALEKSARRIVGTHPTPLPLGRGRHPLHWMQVLGLRTSRLSAFWVEDGVDSGPIISSVQFRIRLFDQVINNTERLNRTSWKLGLKLGVKFLFTYPSGERQNTDAATLFRKRTELDSVIDFRMTAGGIVRHVRSLADPWPLCTAVIEGTLFRVGEAKFAPFALLQKKNRWSTFGTILRAREEDWILVRCDQGAVWIRISRV